MNAADYAFLKELVEAPSPSGFEQPVQRILRRELATVVDELRTDVLGNLIARIDGSGPAPLKVMLAAHCDEIGFMIRYIDEQGFLWFAPIGGVDPHLCPGQRVFVQSETGPILGVIGKKPIHLIETKDRDTVVKFRNQFIDIGCSTRAEAEAVVAIGQPVTFAVTLERLQGEKVTSRAFDDKMGVFVLSQVIKEVRRRGVPAVELYGVSTVQEEVGLRGAVTSAFDLRPDVAIILEVGFASDVPDGEKKEQGEIRLGGGPILSCGPNINPALLARLKATAAREQIPVQILAEAKITGTDANVVQLSRSGVATALVRVPLRYMHTPVEVLSLADLDAAIRLVTALLEQLGDRQELIPT